jgi:short-subunit dehydrogenase
LATAQKLLEEGFFVILTARAESLSRLAGAEFLKKYSHHWIRPLDVRDSQDRHKIINQIEKELGRLDILINNAAVIYRAPIEFTYEFECKEQMLVNFHAPLELIKLALPLMRRHSAARIINVSSAAGFLAVPTMGLYAASKHALEAASEALYHELTPWDIKVTLIEPGFISSDSYKRARLSLAMDRWQPRGGDYALQSNMITSLIDQATGMTSASPEDVADMIAKVVAMKNPPLRALVTLDAKLLSFLKRCLPGRLYDRLLHYCLESIRKQVQASQTLEPSVGSWPSPPLPTRP